MNIKVFFRKILGFQPREAGAVMEKIPKVKIPKQEADKYIPESKQGANLDDIFKIDEFNLPEDPVADKQIEESIARVRAKVVAENPNSTSS